jgi:hypothetical protein
VFEVVRFLPSVFSHYFDHHQVKWQVDDLLWVNVVVVDPLIREDLMHVQLVLMHLEQIQGSPSSLQFG